MLRSVPRNWIFFPRWVEFFAEKTKNWILACQIWRFNPCLIKERPCAGSPTSDISPIKIFPSSIITKQRGIPKTNIMCNVWEFPKPILCVKCTMHNALLIVGCHCVHIHHVGFPNAAVICECSIHQVQLKVNPNIHSKLSLVCDNNCDWARPLTCPGTSQVPCTTFALLAVAIFKTHRNRLFSVVSIFQNPTGTCQFHPYWFDLKIFNKKQVHLAIFDYNFNEFQSIPGSPDRPLESVSQRCSVLK